MRAGTVIQVLKTRPPLFKCAIIMDFKRTSGAKYGLICFHLGQNILSSASIWGKTFYDLLPFGAKTFMICIHLGRVFFFAEGFFDTLIHASPRLQKSSILNKFISLQQKPALNRKKKVQKRSAE